MFIVYNCRGLFILLVLGMSSICCRQHISLRVAFVSFGIKQLHGVDLLLLNHRGMLFWTT